MEHRNKSIRITAAICLLILSVQACTPERQAEQPRNQSAVLHQEPVLEGEPDTLSLDPTGFQKALPVYAKDRKLTPFVSRAEQQSAIQDFPMHFRKNIDTRITNTEIALPWGDVANLVFQVRQAEPNAMNEVLVRFYYGLENGKFQVALAFIPIQLAMGEQYRYMNTPNWSNERVYYWNGQSFDNTMTETQWLARFRNRATNGAYLNDVVVKPQSSSDWYPIHTGPNAGSEEFPWFWELAKLRAQNTDILNTDQVQLVLNCVADDRSDRNRFYHALCLHLRVVRVGVPVPIDLISDAPTPLGAPLKQRGCDYGNLCPPSCPNYEVPTELR